MPQLNRVLVELMIIILTTNLINSQEDTLNIPWHICETETEGIFCFGALNNQTYKAGTGCITNKDCSLFLLADSTSRGNQSLADTVIFWHFYNKADIVSATLTPGMEITFMVTKVQPTQASIVNGFVANTLAAYIAYSDTMTTRIPRYATYIDLGSPRNIVEAIGSTIYDPRAQALGKLDTDPMSKRFTSTTFSSPVVLSYSTQGTQVYNVDLFNDLLFFTLVHKTYHIDIGKRTIDRSSTDNFIISQNVSNLFHYNSGPVRNSTPSTAVPTTQTTVVSLKEGTRTPPQSSKKATTIILILIGLIIVIAVIAVVIVKKKRAARESLELLLDANSSCGLSMGGGRSQYTNLPSGMDSHISAAQSQADSVNI